MRGMTLNNMNAWLTNAAGRMEILRRMPPEWRALLNERSASSDPVETSFSMVMLVCGYKAAMQGVARRIQYMQHRMAAAASPSAAAAARAATTTTHTTAATSGATAPSW